MKARILTVMLLVMALMLACNATATPQLATPAQGTLSGTGSTSMPPAGAPTSPSDTPVLLPGDTSIPLPSDTPIPLPSDTPIPLPSDTPTITLTETPSTAMVTPKTDAANCRFGPGTAYVSVGGLKVGASVPILGQNGDGTWWQILNPNNISDKCWVSASVTNTTGNMGTVPVVAAPQPFVTKVTVSNPDAINVAGCVGPIAPMTITGTIDVNGPVEVTWHFETQQGGALPSHKLTFAKYGPLTVKDSTYTPALVAGTYWVKLFVTSPNSLTAQASYTISCP